MGAQIRSFPYAKISKDLLSSNIIRTNFTIQEHDEQSNQSANKQKTPHFWLPGSVQSPSPTKLGMVIDLEHFLHLVKFGMEESTDPIGTGLGCEAQKTENCTKFK